MSAKNGVQKIQSLCVGLNDYFKQLTQSTLNKLNNKDVACDTDQILALEGIEPLIIFCAPPPDEISPTEIAQLLRMKYPPALIYFLAGEGIKFDRKSYIKNGYSDAFFFPIDQKFFEEEIYRKIVSLSEGEVAYRPVKLIDLSADMSLDFDTYVYLPANNKHIRFSEKGKPLDDKRLKNLKTKSVSSLYVDQTDMPKFYQYTAKVLKKLGDDTGLSATERTERLKNAVRDIVTSLFSDTLTGTDGGKKIVEDCQKIVKTYISEGRTGRVYDQLLSLTGASGGTYSDIANVSTFASLFAIGLGLKSVNEIALAGLLYHVGMSKVPAEIQSKDPQKWTDSERSLYEQHPEFSIEIIKDRKLVLPDLVYKIVSQHHEKYDGSGYPKKIAGDRICIEAQILAFADKFNEMTSISPGKPSVSPEEAVQHFHASLKNPGERMINPDLLKKILSLFQTPITNINAA